MYVMLCFCIEKYGCYELCREFEYGTMDICMETMGVWNAMILYRKVWNLLSSVWKSSVFVWIIVWNSMVFV